MKKSILLMFLFIGLQLSFSPKLAAQATPKTRLGDNFCNDSSAMAGNNPDGFISCKEDKTCLVGTLDGFCNVDKIICPDKIPNICFYHF